MDDKRFDALEQALADLAAGEEIDSLIAANPDIKTEIETAEWVQSLSPKTVPLATMQRSRTRLLSRAMQLGQETSSRGGILQRVPRFAFALVLALILLLSWNGLVFASERALPGDQLYPAKLTLEKLRLGLALNPQTHKEVEGEYQARRVDEVMRLLALERVEFIQFLGIVEEQWDDHWMIEGIEVRLLPETIILGDILSGMTVEVEGATQPEGWVRASEIHLQHFSFTGTVEVISKATWMISGQEVLINSASQIEPEIQVGDTVNVEVDSDDFGTLTARLITLFAVDHNGLQATEAPETLKDAPEENAGDENGEEVDIEEEIEKPEPGELDEGNEADETDEADEIEEIDEQDEPDELDESDDVEEIDEQDEPDETDETDEADKHDETDKQDEADESDERDNDGGDDEINKPED